MRGRRPRHYDDNGLSFTSSVHHLPRRLKSLKKRSGLNCSSLFLPNYLFIVVSKLIPKSQQTMGRMELKIKSSRRNVRIRFRRFVRFNFSHFLSSSYTALSRQWRQGTQQNLETWKRFPFGCYIIPHPRVTCFILVLEIPCYFQGPIFCIFF